MGRADWTVYEGEYKDNKKHGKGKKTYKDEKIEEGEWKEDYFLS